MTETVSQASVQNALPSITEAELSAMIENFITNGKSVKDLHGLTTENLEVVYAVAYNAYQAGNLEQASKLFQFLCYFDHLEHKFWMGLGATRQLLQAYPGAIECYTMASLLNIEDPQAPYHAAQCHLALGNQEAAVSGFTAAIEFSADHPAWAALRDQAASMLQLLQAQATQGD